LGTLEPLRPTLSFDASCKCLVGQPCAKYRPKRLGTDPKEKRPHLDYHGNFCQKRACNGQFRGLKSVLTRLTSPAENKMCYTVYTLVDPRDRFSRAQHGHMAVQRRVCTAVDLSSSPPTHRWNPAHHCTHSSMESGSSRPLIPRRGQPGCRWSPPASPGQ